MLNILKTGVFAIALLVMAAAPSFAEETMKKYGDKFEGAKGEKVEVAYLEGKEEALIVVHGINSEWDGKVIRAVITPAGDKGQNYTIQQDGGDYNVMVVRNPYGWENVELHIPGYDGNPIYLEHKGREGVEPLHLLTQYNKENAEAKKE